jgi:cell fate regulator YaaT (PSP1 superfamily)
MPNVVGIRFRPITKIYFFDPGEFTYLAVNDRAIVETSRGIEMGTVVQPIHEVQGEEIKSKLKQVIRPATPLDLAQAQKYKAEESVALEKCRELVKEMRLELKVIEADYNFDGSRLAFSFVSDQRIDFRDLVKELARALRTRIEMKQVGARDETKVIDGYGRCGRQLCCSSWLTDFHSVSIRMAKKQNLPLAPTEISGVCGRLLCCLAYEDQLYTEMAEQMPRINSMVKTQQGAIAKVRGLNVLKETLLLEIEPEGDDEDATSTYQEVPASEVEPAPDALRKPKRKRP